MLATLLLSFGVPLLLGGDELGRTQRGNNNAYCQDNAITWFDWSHVDADLLAFTKRLIALRRAHPVFRRRRFLAGAEAAELSWYTPSGVPMTTVDWADPNARSLAFTSTEPTTPTAPATAAPSSTTISCVLVNAWWEPLDFVGPGHSARADVARRDRHLRPRLLADPFSAGRRGDCDRRAPLGRAVALGLVGRRRGPSRVRAGARGEPNCARSESS